MHQFLRLFNKQFYETSNETSQLSVLLTDFFQKMQLLKYASENYRNSRNEASFENLKTIFKTFQTNIEEGVQPDLNNRIATCPMQKQMKCFVSCVTQDPKFLPTTQCQVGLYFLSNSFLMKAAISFSILNFSKA